MRGEPISHHRGTGVDAAKPLTRRPAAGGPRVSRALGILLVAVCALLLGGWQTAIAGAKVYCVAPATGCSDGVQSSLQAALTQVKVDGAAGTIVLGSATYTAPAGGFKYSGTVPVEVDGVSSSTTTLTLPVVNNTYVLSASSSGAVTVRSLRVLFPSASTGDTGLKLLGPATITNVLVDGSPAAAPSEGIILTDGGSVSGTVVTLPAATGAALDLSGAAAATVQDSTLAGEVGLFAKGPGTVEVHRCVLTGTSVGVESGEALLAFGGTVSADDSLLRASGTNADAATALNLLATPTTVTMNATQLTMVGNPSDNLVSVQANSAGTVATLHFTDSIIAQPSNSSIFAEQSGGGSASVTTDYSDYYHFGVNTAIVHSGTHDIPYVAPGFVNPAGDFRLLASSPLLNFDPTPLGATPVGATESATDLDGRMRITGTGRDLGAYQHQPPIVNVPTVNVVTPPSAANLLPTLTPMLVTPDVTGASESHATWRSSGKLAGIARRRRTPVGTTFSFGLNESASVRFAFTQRVSGRRVGKSCVAQTKHNRRRSSCNRTVTTATISFAGHAGVNRITFQGRASRTQKLRPGRYVLVITATNAAGERSVPRSLIFTIIKS